MIEFINMGGYGAYIWSAYGACTVLLFGMLITSINKSRKVARQLNHLEQTND